ncbi:MAG TPA: hypothetical protein VHA13_02685, partial [Gammaproteobacteria bacterium]|nr:hypothetical protein [Gammaproteobacteria bacterium]
MQNRERSEQTIQSKITSERNNVNVQQSAGVKLTQCNELGTAEACRSASLQAQDSVVEGTLRGFFTAAKKSIETEVVPGVRATAEVKVGHVEADATVHLEKNKNQIKLGAGAWLAKFDGELGLSEFCIDSIDTCYQLQLKASGGVGWENSLALGLDRSKSSTKISAGAGMGPVKWSAILNVTSRDPSKAHLQKSVALSEQDAQQLANTLLPLKGSTLHDTSRIPFRKFVDKISDNSQHLKEYAKQYADLLYHRLPAEKTNPTQYDMENNWLQHNDEVLKEAISNLAATESEAYLFTRLVETEYYDHERWKDTKTTVTLDAAKSSLKSFSNNAKKLMSDFENRTGVLYNEYQNIEAQYQKTDVRLVKEKSTQAKTRKIFSDMSEIAVNAGWIAHFADKPKLRNQLFTLGQSAHLLPEVFSTSTKALSTLNGLTSGTLPISLSNVLSVFSPLSAFGAFTTILGSVFAEDNDGGDNIMEAVCSYLQSLVQPLYEGIYNIQQNQKVMIEMMKVLHEEVDFVLLNQEQLGQLLIQNFAEIRNQLDHVQQTSVNQHTEVLTNLAGIRSLIQEFRQDDVALIKELVESAIEMGDG